MKRTKAVHTLILVAILFSAPATSFATDTASPQPSQSASSSRQSLTNAQKAAILDANSIFAAAKLNAQNGFDRALADAQAVRDQAIAAAGTNAVDIGAAKKDFRESYKIIYRAYTAALNNAKSIWQASIAAAKAAKKS